MGGQIEKGYVVRGSLSMSCHLVGNRRLKLNRRQHMGTCTTLNVRRAGHTCMHAYKSNVLVIVGFVSSPVVII